MALTNIGKWNENPVAVTARFMPRFLWTTASIDIFVGSQCVIRTGGQMKFTGQAIAQFEHGGTNHSVRIRWGWSKIRSFPIKVEIDEQQIAETNAVVTNWPMSLWPLITVFIWASWNHIR